MKSREPPESDRFLSDLVDTLAGSSIHAQAPGLSPAGALCSVADGLGALASSPQARARMLDELRPYDRFARFEAAVAELLQLPRADAAAALRRIDDPAAWLPQAPGLSYLPVESGPNAGFFLAGFLRVEAGLEFPEHEHLGEEITLVLQGAFEESNSGVLFRPGEPSYMPAGSRHTFRVLADGPHLVGLVTVKLGVRLVPSQG
jgi:quercetin dioxygenase-like cupin family protein